MATIPDEAGLTPEWLTLQLRRAGIDATVSGCTATPIGTGQIGKCLRLQLVYADPASATAQRAPKTLVAKLPSDDPQSRMTGVALRNYLKEVRFYQVMAQSLAIRTPHCYFSDIDGEGPVFALLLEDLQPAKQGDQLAGTSASVARAALLELVGLHAPSWNNADLLAYEWLGSGAMVSEDALGQLYRDQVPGFMDRYGSQLTDDERAIIEAYGDHIGKLAAASAGPRTLVHVDYRLDNLLINEQVQPPAVTTVDWQSVTVGSPLSDVAYFIGAGLRKDLRRTAEDALVRDYYTALQSQGIVDYGWDECWRDYRLGSFAGFGVTVVASMLVQQTERGDQMFITMARRHSRHALDLKAMELLG